MVTSVEARRLELAIDAVEREQRTTDVNVQTLAGKLTTLEVAVAKHAGVCDERYVRINDHMNASIVDRADLRRMLRNTTAAIIMLLLGIIAYMLTRFGLPPAIHP